MDLTLSDEQIEFRDSLRAWLIENLPEPWTQPHRTPEHVRYLLDWQRKLYEGGWAGLTWPKEYGGRGATPMEQAIFQQELAQAEAPEMVALIGLSIIGPTIITVGTPEQKQRHLSKILSGEEVWCQGFSEPNAGSDVAGLRTRAVREGDSFVVNGQKIWTSVAHLAKWCLLLVRTTTSEAKHQGLTALLVDMQSPGVEVRPLRQMTGDSGFNEIFFTNVRVPVSQVLGEIDQGWNVAITTLMNERANLGSGFHVVSKRLLDNLIARAKNTRRASGPVTEDPLCRQKLAQSVIELEVYRLLTLRALSKLTRDRKPGPEGSLLKLYWSEMNQRNMQRAMEVLGPVAQCAELDQGKWVYHYLRSRGNTIEAGTSEILRNIIAQRVLGLPRSY